MNILYFMVHAIDGFGGGYRRNTQSIDESGKVANPARGQLNGEDWYFPVPVCA